MADALVVNELVALVSDLMSRAQLATRMGQAFQGKRDYYDVFGYEKAPTCDVFFSWYRRGGLAKRIIELPCEATWRHAPEILDDESPESENAFESAWTQLNKRLGLISRLKRADILQSIG